MIAPRPIRALAVGHVTLDRFGTDFHPGGSALYASLVFHHLGARTTLITAHGDDFSPGRILEGIETWVLPGRTTTTFENTYPVSGPRVMRVAHPAPPLRPADFPPPPETTVAFLAPVAGEVPLTAWVNRLRGVTVIGLGLQGFLKRAGAPAAAAMCELAPRPFLPSDEVLKKIDAVFCSQEDLSGYGSDALFDRLRRAVPLVAVTNGDAGAAVFERGRPFRVGVLPADVIDPTGAGDSFAAGFLFGLGMGASPREAARIGTAVAANVIGKKGVAGTRESAEALESATRVPVFPA